MSLVLVLQDDPALRFALSRALEVCGYDVFATDSAQTAIAYMRTTKPVLLVLELVVDGSVTTNVADCAVLSAPGAQVIFVTGSRLFPRGELFGMAANLRWVLRRPFGLRELTDMVRHLHPMDAGAPVRTQGELSQRDARGI
ncbi:MAG: response regulator [Pseudomonadota bacterium]